MSSKNHVIFRTPSENTQVVLSAYTGMLPIYMSFDSNGKPIESHDTPISFETILNGHSADSYGNKPVSHNYVTGIVDLTPACLSPDTTFESSLGQLPRRAIYYKNSFVDEIITPGSGQKSPGMCYYVVTSNTSTLYACECYRPDGHLESTSSWTRTSLTILSANWLIADYKHTVIFSDYWKKEAGAVDFTTTELKKYGQFRLVGYSSGEAPSLPLLCGMVIHGGPSTIVGPSIPPTLTDDIFSKFTLPDVNNCENLLQLKKIKESIPPIRDLIKRHNIKSLSGLYLWYKYTYSTSMMDLQAYYKFMLDYVQQSKSKSDNQHISLTYSDVISTLKGSISRITRYNIYTNTYNGGVMELLGLDVNLSNTWDLIPFSFVVDWFVNLGDILNTIDNSDTLSHVKVYSVCTSNKCTCSYHPFTSLGIFDAVCRTTYDRGISNTLPVGNLSVSLKNPLRHIIDGGALIFANKH